MNTSNKIRHFREIGGFTQKELAEKAGVSEITVRKYESGEVPITLDTLAKIALALGINLLDLHTCESLGFTAEEIAELKKEVESKETYSIELFNRCKDAEGKLKSYEDTGLEPEEVMEYKKFEDNLLKQYHYGLQRALDLLEKEKQGWLVELPCKVGDVVYLIFNDFGELFMSTGWVVEEITITDDDIFFDFKCCETDEEEERVLKDFGKTVFLIQEQAEQALNK